MTLQDKQAQLIEDFSLIENPLERFSAIVDQYRKAGAMPASEQIEENRVHGCVSQVWVAGSCESGVCQFRSEADSSILQGIVRLLTEFYSGAKPDEVIAVEPEFLDKLRIGDQLSPTRRNGLRHVRARIVELARAYLHDGVNAYYDAHCHLQDPRFGDEFEGIVAACRTRGIAKMVVNGTRESDWDRVAALAERFPDLVIPSYGLHPWWSRDRSARWREDLVDRLLANPVAGIGETGLDRWMENPDPADQEEVLVAHLDLAVRLDRPLSLHCLRSWGQLLEVLKAHPRPARGFLLHSYGGPAEMVRTFVELGAYFSFAGYFLNPPQEKKRAAFRIVPADRLLIESDAPDQALPEELDEFHLCDPATGKRLNHPANVPAIYQHWPAAEPDQVAANFHRLFAFGGTR